MLYRYLAPKSKGVYDGTPVTVPSTTYEYPRVGNDRRLHFPAAISPDRTRLYVTEKYRSTVFNDPANPQDTRHTSRYIDLPALASSGNAQDSVVSFGSTVTGGVYSVGTVSYNTVPEWTYWINDQNDVYRKTLENKKVSGTDRQCQAFQKFDANGNVGWSAANIYVILPEQHLRPLFANSLNVYGNGRFLDSSPVSGSSPSGVSYRQDTSFVFTPSQLAIRQATAPRFPTNLRKIGRSFYVLEPTRYALVDAEQYTPTSGDVALNYQNRPSALNNNWVDYEISDDRFISPISGTEAAEVYELNGGSLSKIGEIDIPNYFSTINGYTSRVTGFTTATKLGRNKDHFILTITRWYDTLNITRYYSCLMKNTPTGVEFCKIINTDNSISFYKRYYPMYDGNLISVSESSNWTAVYTIINLNDFIDNGYE